MSSIALLDVSILFCKTEEALAKKATMLLVELYLCTYQVTTILVNNTGTSIWILCINVETLNTEKNECRMTRKIVFFLHFIKNSKHNPPLKIFVRADKNKN